MKTYVVETSYGKQGIDFIWVAPDRKEVSDVTVNVHFRGHFARAYTAGDNAGLVTTDSMMRIVLCLAVDSGLRSIDDFQIALFNGFRKQYPHFAEAEIEVTKYPWWPITVDGKPRPCAFTARSERDVCRCAGDSKGKRLRAGFTNLRLLKTRGSAFSGFLHDQYTLLPESRDRLFCTNVTADWACDESGVDWASVRRRAIAALCRAFADHGQSESVQHTQHYCAEAIFADCPELAELSLEMPNVHYIPADLTPFARRNDSAVFLRTAAPSGNIRGTYSRTPR